MLQATTMPHTSESEQIAAVAGFSQYVSVNLSYSPQRVHTSAVRPVVVGVSESDCVGVSTSTPTPFAASYAAVSPGPVELSGCVAMSSPMLNVQTGVPLTLSNVVMQQQQSVRVQQQPYHSCKLFVAGEFPLVHSDDAPMLQPQVLGLAQNIQQEQQQQQHVHVHVEQDRTLYEAQIQPSHTLPQNISQQHMRVQEVYDGRMQAPPHERTQNIQQQPIQVHMKRHRENTLECTTNKRISPCAGPYQHYYQPTIPQQAQVQVVNKLGGGSEFAFKSSPIQPALAGQPVLHAGAFQPSFEGKRQQEHLQQQQHQQQQHIVQQHHIHQLQQQYQHQQYQHRPAAVNQFVREPNGVTYQQSATPHSLSGGFWAGYI
jgi:hypothetical protein